MRLEEQAERMPQLQCEGSPVLLVEGVRYREGPLYQTGTASLVVELTARFKGRMSRMYIIPILPHKAVLCRCHFQAYTHIVNAAAPVIYFP